MTTVIAHFHCFNDLYIKIFPTMLRIGRLRIHHCYCYFPFFFLAQLEAGASS